ncbi:MAG TPA: DUF3426 domain-containing protein [Candidatus Binataceae bacterium]|nr:DUF3426 domain-containing protein [Candidatus Binataceae bacterium]
MVDEPRRDDSDRWQDGEEDSVLPPAAMDRGRRFTSERVAPPVRRKPSRAQQQQLHEEPDFIDEAEFVDEAEAPVYNRAVTHSGRFFLLLFLLVGIAFAAATMLIHNGPAGAEVVLGHLPFVGNRFVVPSAPARLVALRDVSATYQRSKDGHNALVVSGTAENVGGNPLRVVQLTTSLRGPQRQAVVSQAVYCGNNLATKMVAQMTPHEIEFFQKLEPPKTFTLEQSATCPFVAVFIDPPPGVSGYDVSVSQAVQAEAATDPAS